MSKDYIAVKLGINPGDLIECLAKVVRVELKNKLTTDTEFLFQKSAAVGEQVINHVIDCLKEIAEEPHACLKFAFELGVLPKDAKREVEVTEENAEAILNQMEVDGDDVPKEVKDFLRSMVNLTKKMNETKKEKRAH